MHGLSLSRVSAWTNVHLNKLHSKCILDGVIHRAPDTSLKNLCGFAKLPNAEVLVSHPPIRLSSFSGRALCRASGQMWVTISISPLQQWCPGTVLSLTKFYIVHCPTGEMASGAAGPAGAAPPSTLGNIDQKQRMNGH